VFSNKRADKAKRRSLCIAHLDSLSLTLGSNAVVAVRVDVGARSADLVLNSRVLLVVVVDVETKTGRVNTAVTPDEKSTEDGLGDQVEDTVEDGLRVGRDDVATLADTPGERVQDPEKSG
jgi:hypothetical protein